MDGSPHLSANIRQWYGDSRGHWEGNTLVIAVRSRSFGVGVNASPTPSPYWGADIWKRSADPRSVAIDGQGRVWVAVRNREARKQPPFCVEQPNKFGRFYPLRQSNRQLAVYDPKTREWSHIDTCFSADHNQIGADNFIYFGVGSAVAWVDINTWDRTHDAEASQGWCPGVLDSNGDGEITAPWTEPNEPIDPTKDHRINFGAYSILARERTLLVFRPQQVQYDARPSSDWPELSRGLEFLPKKRSDVHQQRLSRRSKLSDAHGLP
jgi:hypothetical protein